MTWVEIIVIALMVCLTVFTISHAGIVLYRDSRGPDE